MIVILVNRHNPEDEMLNDAPNSSRICWDGWREDRWVDMTVYQLSVVPS